MGILFLDKFPHRLIRIILTVNYQWHSPVMLVIVLVLEVKSSIMSLHLLSAPRFISTSGANVFPQWLQYQTTSCENERLFDGEGVSSRR